MKRCFKCGVAKELNDFYKHPQMADGHVNKCKECNKNDVKENRIVNIQYYREYDRKRGNRQGPEYFKEYNSKYPNKYRAHTLVSNAIRSGKLHPEPCCECGSLENTHAHHDDYAKPLNIRWMCASCHKYWHLINGEAKNG